MSYIALHDSRLSGTVPKRQGLMIVKTSATTHLSQAFAHINGAGSTHTLFILCHGYAGANQRGRVSMDAGGMGLNLGREDLLHGNVHNWRAIRGRVQNIVVYACAAANTEFGNRGTTADGEYLMGALALHTEAHVFAADRIQWYRTPHGLFDWGKWEGRVLHFSPTGEPPEEGTPLVEFKDVVDGTAP